MSLARLDFNAIKGQARFERVLEHYGLKFPGSGVQRFVLCPFHRESTPSCSIHLTRRIFHCFGCGAKGTIIDFVAMTERIALREAAIKVTEICGIEPREADGGQLLQPDLRVTVAECREPDHRGINPPLTHALPLDPAHPYLAGRGLTPELIELFGLGYCAHGSMRGRICIPIHNADGKLVGYAGRWAGDTIPIGIRRYLLSKGLQRRYLLFNLNRIDVGDHLVLVEGYWSVFRLHALGIPVAGLMGTAISAEQYQLLKQTQVRLITILMDGDEPGYRARERLLITLGDDFYVRGPRLKSREKPDTISTEELLTLVWSK